MNLEIFKNKHKGGVAVIIAGGPSLKNTNIDVFPETFYRLGVSLTYKGIDFIDYQFIGDENIFSQVYKDFENGHGFQQLFVSKTIYDKYKNKINTRNISYFTGTGGRKEFSTDLTKGVYGGGTSTYLAMQFAYYMGFDLVYVVGLDHSWKYDTTKKVGEGSGGDLLEHVGEDVNHFMDDFYPEGLKWFKPKEDKMLESYAMASKAYKDAGRILLNASIETKVPSNIIERYRNLELIKNEN